MTVTSHIPRPLGALRQWRREVSAGFRGQRLENAASWILDDLHRAACLEAEGSDLRASGSHVGAANAFDDARRVLQTAVLRRRRDS